MIRRRSLSSTASEYLSALGRYGIPAVCDRGGSLLDTSEVQILVSILQIIDNPHQDVPLLAALASPVFGYSPDQLALPRTTERDSDYYDTIQNHTEFEPVVSLIRELQEDEKWLNLHELIDAVFRRTGMLSVFASMPDGLRRERNLMAFRNFVVSFETTGNRSLVHLLGYIKDLRDSGGYLPIPKGSHENAVTIMTIHSSKGLEFPVVFLSDLSRTFNMRDMQDAILVDDDLAVGCNRVDNQRFVRYSTLAKNAIIHKQTSEAVSEELRILYVAMTRARDRLIMTYYSRYLLTELKNINMQLTVPLDDDLCMSANNPGKWILMAALCRTEAGELFALCGENDVSAVRESPWNIQFHDLAAYGQVGETQADVRDLAIETPDETSIALIDYQYPYRNVAAIPGKITATQLKGRIQDQEAANGAEELKRTSAFRFRKPLFMDQKLSSAERGTATHLFMQFAAYDSCKSMEKILQERERLCASGFLTQEQGSVIDLNRVVRFFESDLGKWLLNCETKREFKFSIMVDAAEFGFEAENEPILLQGVIDVFAIEDDGLTILDFKTDRTPKPEKYVSQLDAYEKALSRIYQMPVKQKILYFFATGEAVYL